MYEIQVIEELDSGHILDLPYESKCSNIHGHCWKVMVTLTTPDLNECGMVVDFTHIKAILKRFDHKFFVNEEHPIASHLQDFQSAAAQKGKYLNVPGHDAYGIILLPFEPTAECLATHFLEEIVSVLFAERYKKPDGNYVQVPKAEETKVISVEIWETKSGRVIYKP